MTIIDVHQKSFRILRSFTFLQNIQLNLLLFSEIARLSECNHLIDIYFAAVQDRVISVKFCAITMCTAKKQIIPVILPVKVPTMRCKMIYLI